MLDRITPLILTFNEAPNISRSLEALRWAREVVVVDSYSTDETLAIVAGFPNARLVQRRFDAHAEQWNFGLKDCGISTDWVLALDADFLVPRECVEELCQLAPTEDVTGFEARFVYCIGGRPIRGGAYPPVTVLFRRDRGHYFQDGHTQRVRIDGRTERLRERLRHDDRKSLTRWFSSQDRYMRLEAKKLASSTWAELGYADRIRCMRIVAPLAMFVYCLFGRGAILDGLPGIFYSFQRTFAELLLSLYLIEGDLARRNQ